VYQSTARLAVLVRVTDSAWLISVTVSKTARLAVLVRVTDSAWLISWYSFGCKPFQLQ
jgi:hypothetical protein